MTNQIFHSGPEVAFVASQGAHRQSPNEAPAGLQEAQEPCPQGLVDLDLDKWRCFDISNFPRCPVVPGVRLPFSSKVAGGTRPLVGCCLQL